MHQCPTCGKQLDDSVRFCPDDGTPLTDTAAAASARTPATKRPSSRHLQLPVVVGQRYRLVEFRGGGGMAKVYRAVDLTLEREVAVKLINPELRAEPEFDARFQREARIASQLADPHIVVVHDFGIDAEHGPFLVMEYLKGHSMRERLQAEGPLPLKAGLQLAGQLLLALIHAHEKGIVHRDIKPDNIFLLSQSGVRLHVRVLDFGIARIYRQGAGGNSPETLTHPGAVLGTPRYMSPEQLASQPVDARSDLYTAAVVIHEALTGQLPYVGGKKLSELCPEAPAALQDLLDHCLKPNPNERPQSAIEVYVRLQELGKASGVLLLPPGALDRLLAARQVGEPTVEYVAPKSKTPSRRRWLLMAGVIALLVLVPLGGWGVWALLRKPPPPPAEESLLGIKIGDSREDVVALLGHLGITPTRHQVSNPWPSIGKPLPYFGHVLRPDDLPFGDALLDLEVGPNREVCVVLDPDPRKSVRGQKVIGAVVVRDLSRAATARGLRVNASVAELFRLYPEPPTEVLEVRLDDAAGQRGGATHVEVRRHDPLGIGFEVQGGRVTSITLYPPQAKGDAK